MITQEQIKAFNLAKQNLHYLNSFTKDELIKMFKDCCIPTNQYLIGVLLSNNFITTIPSNRSKGNKQLYRFSSKDPVYIGHLENWIRKAREKKAVAQKEWLDRKQEKASVTAESSEEEKAIALLKSKGYKIYKPTVQFEEI